jgi:hypothetical protein
MSNREEPPYDPYIPNGGAAAGQGAQNGNHRTAALQAVRRHPPMLPEQSDAAPHSAAISARAVEMA